jgi:hypothetical protein
VNFGLDIPPALLLKIFYVDVPEKDVLGVTRIWVQVKITLTFS